jgi:hypothetical protein
MLKDLNDVQAYTERLASPLPDLASEIALRSNGIPDPALAELAEEIELPPIYRNCAGTLHLYGVSIGYFALWPGFRRDSDLLSALRAANLNNEADAAAARADGLVIVGREEANWICVGRASSDRSDAVFYLKTMASPDRVSSEIAPSFDKFLILAANLHQIAYESSVDVGAGIGDLAERCDAIGCGPGQAAFWTAKLSELLA